MSYPGQYASYGRGYPPPGQPAAYGSAAPAAYATAPQGAQPGAYATAPQGQPGAYATAPQGQPGAPQGAWAPPPGAYASQPGGYPPGAYAQQPPPGYASHAPSQGGYPGGPAQQQRPAWAQGYYNQLTPQELSNLQAWFTSVDRDRSGYITAQELASANFNGHRFSLDTASVLVKVFDLDRNGNIGFYEYASLHKFIVSMQGAFYHFDRDRSGSLELHELDAALRQGGFTFSPQIVHSIGARFAQGARGLNMEQFIRMSAVLGRIRSNFERRDPQRRGYISISFEDLVLLVVD